MAAGVIKNVTPWNRGAGHFVTGQHNYERANEEIILAAHAAAYPAGQLLGQLTAGDKNHTAYNPSGSDGSQTFAGILWDDAPIATGTQRAVGVKRETTVNAHALVGFDAMSTANKTALIAAAKAMGIIILV